MKKFDLEAISRDRLVLANPYAHMEYLEKDSLPNKLKSEATPNRRRYRHINSKELNEATQETRDSVGFKNASSRIVVKSRSERDSEIKTIVNSIHKKIWRERHRLPIGQTPNNPINLLDPTVVLDNLGYSLEFVEGYGPEIKNGKTIVPAGELDYSNKKVSISLQFPIEQQRFTAAHELGHAVLHGKSIGLHHRDRSFDGVNISKDEIEWEADRFAVHFLTPEKLVRAQFQKRFNVSKFYPTPKSVGALGFVSLTHFYTDIKNKRDLSRLLASSKDYAGKYFGSCLATDLKISIAALARRLEELRLVDFKK